MSTSITEVQVFGHNRNPIGNNGNGNNKIRLSEFNQAEFRGQMRYRKLNANSVRIRGTQLEAVHSVMISHTGYWFKILDRKLHNFEDETVLVVWFLAFASSDEERAKPTLLDFDNLTVTIETSGEPASGEDPEVEYEDDPGP